MKENKKVSLFLNSATKALQIGLLVGDRKEVIELPDPKKALETIHKGMEELFHRTDTHLKDVDAFYLLLGPGSNTGIRLGLTIPRTVYAMNPNIELYGIGTLELLTEVASHAALSDRNGNLYYGTREEGKTSFVRVDKEEILKLPKEEIALEEKDAVARDELASYPVHPVDVLSLMMEKKDAFRNYSSDEENYLPEYLLKI